MRSIKDYIFEVSKETAEKAKNAAIKDIKKLTQEFTDSKFKDMDILAKLQKRARQVDVFANYIEAANGQAIEIFVDSVQKVLNKWKEGRELSNGATFRPIFTITSGEKWEYGKNRGYTIDWDEAPNTDLCYLTAIGLNSDFDKEIKAVTKAGGDTSSLEAIFEEYEKINNELIGDLSKVLGLEYSSMEAKRKNSKNPYNTIVITFTVDKKSIDLDTAAKILPGYLNDYVSPAKYDRMRGSDKRGHYTGVVRTRQKSQQLNY